MDPERLVEDLNESQRAAVTSEAAPLCIIAGAGTGKTRVLTRRIAHRVATDRADARHVLALTFTRKAAGELGSRLRSLGLRESVSAGTFHSIAYAQLRSLWADRNITAPQLLDRKIGFVARLLPSSVPAIDIVTEIEWAKARRIAPEMYHHEAELAGRKPALALGDVGSHFARYEDAKRKARMVDFDDLLRLCIRAITERAEFADAQRWRFRHLFVDEFQDVNPLQIDLLRAWLGDRSDICVVGDPNQAIYAWNGADARYLQRFERYFPGAARIELAQNYRSTPQIIAAANAVLPSGSATLVATRSDGPVPAIRTYSDDTSEARGVARAVRDKRNPGAPWSSQAVLVRTNAQCALIAEALAEARIPHRVRGGAGLLDRPEVRSALAALRRHRGELPAAIAEFEAGITQPEPGAGQSADEDERTANLQMLIQLSDDYLRIDARPSPIGFVEWLTATVGSDSPERDAVDIATFHAAKGLEWPIVHIAGLEAGLVPISHADTPAALAEERRLLFVALSRAEQELACSFAEKRRFGRRTSARSASPYLAQIQAALADPETSSQDLAERVREQRRALGSRIGAGARSARVDEPASLDPADTKLFEALRHWRSTKARAANVPAYVIFNDATLATVAATRPSTHDELLAVPGIGPVKAERHGRDLLELVARAEP